MPEGSRTGLLSAEHLTVSFGRGNSAAKALIDVSVAFRPGTLTCIMGPSGSGKTTLLSVLGCLLKPDSGRVILDGTDVSSLSESRRAEVRQRNIGFIFQAFRLFRSLSALDNVTITGAIRGFGASSHTARAATLLDGLGLTPKLHLRPDELSGGEKQRVAIARALLQDPPVILADEPTAALDSAAGAQVGGILRNLARQDGKTVVVVSHDPRWQGLADELIHLADGRVVQHREEVFQCVTR